MYSEYNQPVSIECQNKMNKGSRSWKKLWKQRRRRRRIKKKSHININAEYLCVLTKDFAFSFHGLALIFFLHFTLYITIILIVWVAAIHKIYTHGHAHSFQSNRL